MVNKKVVHLRRTDAEIAKLSLADLAIAIHRDGDFALGSRLPAATYSLVRDLAESMGLVGPTARKRANKPLQDSVDKNKPPTFNLETTKLRMEFSEAECRRLYLHKTGEATPDGLTLEKIAKLDPEKYLRLRKAAESYGIVPARTERPAPKPKVVDDGRFTIAPELAAKANLPLNTRLNSEEFGQLLLLVNPTPVEPDFSTETMMPSLKKDNE